MGRSPEEVIEDIDREEDLSVNDRNKLKAEEALQDLTALPATDVADYEEMPEYTAVFSTEKAVMLDIDGDRYWFPLSQMRLHDKSVYIASWLYEEKGL